jgi:IS5 family transposase
MTGVRARKAYTDRGCQSQRIGETEIHSPSNGKGKTVAEKTRLRKSFRRRAAIEPDIGHLKSDYGLGRNYLKGELGDEINAMLAASAFNFKSWMRKAGGQLIFVINYWLRSLSKMLNEPQRRFSGDFSKVRQNEYLG